MRLIRRNRALLKLQFNRIRNNNAVGFLNFNIKRNVLSKLAERRRW